MLSAAGGLAFAPWQFQLVCFIGRSTAPVTFIPYSFCRSRLFSLGFFTFLLAFISYSFSRSRVSSLDYHFPAGMFMPSAVIFPTFFRIRRSGWGFEPHHSVVSQVTVLGRFDSRRLHREVSNDGFPRIQQIQGGLGEERQSSEHFDPSSSSDYPNRSYH